MKGSLISQNHFWLDVLHVFVGIAVTVLAVFAFLSPEEYPFFFSLIFGLAGSTVRFVLPLFGAHTGKRAVPWL